MKFTYLNYTKTKVSGKDLKPLIAVLCSAVLFLNFGCKSATREQQSSDIVPSPQLDIESVRNKKIGLSMKTLSAPYFVAQVGAIQSKTEEFGMKFSYINAEDDINKQVASVEDLLAQGIDVLILNPLDPKALVQSTKAATKAGVPVIIIDSSIDQSADFVTNILSNNIENGELVGEWLVRKTTGKRLRIALLSGAQGNPVGKERRQGIFRGIY
jgi:ribose transport system substrate-binding protein